MRTLDDQPPTLMSFSPIVHVVVAETHTKESSKQNVRKVGQSSTG